MNRGIPYRTHSTTMASDVIQDKDNQEQPLSLHDNAEAPRETLIDTAIKFLQNPKVRNSPLAHKKRFLESKGLTPSEIAIAIEKSGTANEVARLPSVESKPIPYSHYGQSPIILPSKWTRLRDYCTAAALICGAVYGVYYFSKKYFLPYVLGIPPEEEKVAMIEKELRDFQISTGTSLLLLQNTLQDLQTTLHQLTEKQDTLLATQGVPKNMDTQFNDLRAEITSLKGLLLNRHQFPAVPAINPIIPTWQMRNNMDASSQGQTNFTEELDAADGTENDVPSV